ncbi:hypothetical protein PNOK_0596300 [Pyrrhoderma noxium]|uniref:PITH domain-containing protein n=1 Tax=Pyrrhoderma noxium TaxID=2282107 RepID=A0A286UHX9_9AGAM|nr:hypothetical protein PNOK_0596300 [Pyrrhoderma noxium]
MSTSTNLAGDRNLLEHVDPSQVNCLNESTNHTLKSILSRGEPAADAYLVSDADEELLLNVYFTQKVRLRSIALRTKENEIASAPKTIKLYINRPAIGFEDVQDSEAEQTFELSEEDVKSGKQIQLRYVRFQNVNSLHIFVADNQGGEETTRIDRIEFYGNLNEGTKDLSALGKQDDE